MYMFREDRNMNDLLDGRSITYVAKEISLNREWVSLILRGKKTCTKEQAGALVKRCASGAPVDYFFKLVTKEGC